MAESTLISFTHREVVEALLNKEKVHKGIWGIYVKFGIKGANLGSSESDLLPSAIVPILEIGLQKFNEVNNLSVDAAQANPKPKPARKKRGSKKR